MNNELFNHQKSDAVKWVCTLLAFLIVGVLIAGIICGWFDKKETPPVENELAQETVNLQSVKLAMSATATVAADNSISKTITATVFPEDAKNKALDWNLEWLDETNETDIAEFLTLTPETDGGLTATLTCLKPFEGEALITATSREGNVFDTCRAVYVGNPTVLDIQPQAFSATSGTIGSYYELGAESSYTFNLVPNNVFGQVGAECNYTYEVTAVGSIKVQDQLYYTVNDGRTWQEGTENTVNISDITTVSKYEPSVFDCTISGNALTIKINCTLESYYEDSIRQGNMITYYQRFKEYTSDNWYYELKVTETNSGISKSFKFRPVKVVTTVVLADEVITF